MVHIHRAFGRRIPLTLILFFFFVLPPLTSDNVSASDTDLTESRFPQMANFMLADLIDAEKGFTLIAPHGKNNVYLVDYQGSIVHTWRCASTNQGTVELLANGTLLRGRSGTSTTPPGVHILDWNGTVLWDYTPTGKWQWHHDIEPMPNGNLLMNVERQFSSDEAIALGRDPETTKFVFRLEGVMEVRPNGTNGGDVVWEWDPVDHLIQDIDPTKSNYGSVENHPELIDFNYPKGLTTEWQHSNSVAYNAELDQVMITDRNFEEFWVIDHNTTTAEAAGHSGGARGKGGDLLYRWGNPQAYRAGGTADHVFFGPHDAHWIAPGLPGEGNVVVFNNGVGPKDSRPEGRFSSVDEMVPQMNGTGGYNLTPGSAYGPSTLYRQYNATPPSMFMTWAMGSSMRLPNGNTLIGGGSSGYNFEIDTKNEVVWDYQSDGVFKVSRYYPPGLDEIPDINATEDIPLSINISSYIWDLDTDHEDLVIKERSHFATINGHQLQLNYSQGITIDEFDLIVSDGIFETERKVRVNVTPVNDPPVITRIPKVEAVEDVLLTLDLAPFIVDPDTTINKMTISVDSSFVTVDRWNLDFLYPDGVLTDSVLLVVSDGEWEVSTRIQVTITPTNDPPIVAPIPDQELVEDVPILLDLGQYITDIDTTIEEIWVTSNSIYATLTGLNMELLYPNGVTRDVVRLTVHDGQDDVATRFNVTVEPVNDLPLILHIPPVTIREDEPTSLNIGPFIFDIDTPRDELVLHVASQYVSVEGFNLTLFYTEEVGRDEVTIEVFDGDLNASATLVVHVEPVNDPPVIHDIQSLTIREDEPYALDVGPYIHDVDSPWEELTLRVDSPYAVVEGHVLLLLYPEGVHQEWIVVEVWDGDLSASTTLVVDIEPVNDPPTWAELPYIAATEDIECEFDMGPYMTDADTPVGDLVVEADSVYGTMEGQVFRFSYPNGVLEELVSFTLTDGEFRVLLEVPVIVSPVNDAPELSGAVVSPKEGRGRTSFIFTVVFKDIDMISDAPVVETVIDGVPYACVRDEVDGGSFEDGVVFHLRMELGPGEHSFHFTANDGSGGKTTTEEQSVNVKGLPREADVSDPLVIVVPILILCVVVIPVLLLSRIRGRSRRSR